MHSFFLSLDDDLRTLEFAAQLQELSAVALRAPAETSSSEEELQTDGVDEDFSMLTISGSYLVGSSARGR
jgi:hypothetical protein